MKLRLVTLMAMIFTFAFALGAHARKPAVENFTGVEPESYNSTSQGMEVQFNFGNHIQAVYKTPTVETSSVGTPQWLATTSLVAFILLPFLMWLGITHSMKEINTVVAKSESDVEATPVTPMENVHNLKDYQTTKDKKDSGKKAA